MNPPAQDGERKILTPREMLGIAPKTLEAFMYEWEETSSPLERRRVLGRYQKFLDEIGEHITLQEQSVSDALELQAQRPDDQIAACHTAATKTTYERILNFYSRAASFQEEMRAGHTQSSFRVVRSGQQ